MPTTWECFRGAAVTLAGAGSIKQRLVEAYRSHLATVADADLPYEIRQDFRSLVARLNESPKVGGLGPVEASVRKLSDGDASAIAGRIVEMFATVSEQGREVTRTPTLRAVNAPDEPVPPLLRAR